jgi:SOS-response transcriptional repressor LexA
VRILAARSVAAQPIPEDPLLRKLQSMIADKRGKLQAALVEAERGLADLLAVRQASEASNGQIVVARVDGGVTVKRLRRRGNTIELLPENPDFEPIVVDARTDDFALEGIGVGLVRTGKSL